VLLVSSPILRLQADTPHWQAPALTTAELFSATKIWNVHLTFTGEAWKTLMPPPAPTLAEMGFRPAGNVGFVSPEGRRNGISGFRGIDFEYVHGAIDLDGRQFADVAVRLKGNGSFTPVAKFGKPSFKIDLNKYVKGQKIAGVSTINLHNNLTDASWMNEVLALRLYRDAGTPAPRTAYARVYVTIAGSQTRAYQGLYSVVENVDTNFTDEYYKVKGGAILKPVTTALFHDDGPDWKAYQQIYDPKTDLTPADRARVIEFARLVTHASDDVFARRLAEFVDVEAFAKHMAVMVWIANPDSLLSQGQNFYIHLHPTTRQFSFIPWDHDHSFGQFSPWRTPQSQQQLDILRPWSPGSFIAEGQGRLLERVFALETFRTPYLAALANLNQKLAHPTRLAAQIDELAALLSPIVVDEPIAARADAFKQSLGEEPFARPIAPNVTLVPIRVFLKARHASVQAQLQAAGIR
jgi:hypothetical protein